jgi:hypothetical protein
MIRPATPEDFACVLFFLYGAAKEKQIWMGRKARDAFDAACRINYTDPDHMWSKLEMEYAGTSK